MVKNLRMATRECHIKVEALWRELGLMLPPWSHNREADPGLCRLAPLHHIGLAPSSLSLEWSTGCVCVCVSVDIERLGSGLGFTSDQQCDVG